MLDRDGYPPGVPCWVDTAQPDTDAAARFYRGLFGWEFEDRMPPDAPGNYLVASLDGLDVAAVGSAPEGAPATAAWNMYIWDFLERRDPDVRSRQDDVGAPPGFEDAIAWLMPMTSDQFPDDVPAHWSVTFAVDDTDAVVARAADLGGNVSVPPVDAPFVRSAVISDPQGAVLTVSKFVPPT